MVKLYIFLDMIRVQGLTKIYRKYNAGEGLLGMARNFALRRYENIAAVEGVSFEIEAGSCVGLLGANGAGKTTLVKMLAGLLVPTSGEALVMGEIPWHRHNAFLRRIGVVMGQRQQLWIDVSARENLKLNQVVYDIPLADFKDRLKSLSQMLEVENLLDVQVRKLSLGEKMKMELCAALLHRPRLLFLDEPTIGLDVVAQNRIREFIREQVRNDGVTVLLTSHYMKDLEELCPRVFLIQSGQLLHDGPLSALVGRLGDIKRVSFTVLDAGTVPEALGARKGDDGRYHIEISAKDVSAVLRTLMNAVNVDDLSVMAPPIEERVRQIMQQGRVPV